MPIFLLLSIISFLLGPIIYYISDKNKKTIQLLDSYILISILGIFIIFLLPDIIIKDGWWSLLFVFIGLLLPKIINHKHQENQSIEKLSLFIILLGISIHTLLEGMALSMSNHRGGSFSLSFGIAVILHKLPVGLLIWGLFYKNLGKKFAIFSLMILIITTVIGFYSTETVNLWATGKFWGYFQALAVGSIIHIIYDHPILFSEENNSHNAHHHHHSNNKIKISYSGIGGIFGLLTIYLLLIADSFPSISEPYKTYFHSLYELSLISAPALLLGYFLAGTLEVFLPQSSILWLKKGNSSMQAIKGMILGLPTPICSCGVVPVYRSLVQRGAPPAAALSFLIATPELGIDAVLLSIPLFGTKFTIVRLIGAGLVAFSVAWFVSRYIKKNETEAIKTEPVNPENRSILERLKIAIKTGFGETLEHTAPWILLGLLIAAYIEPFMGKEFFQLFHSKWDVLIFSVLGIPVYICATGATPFVAILVAKGISPGAGLAFLLTGPATNMTTFGVIAQVHGKKIAFIFILSMITSAVLLGYSVNPLFTETYIPKESSKEEIFTIIQQISLVILALAFLKTFLINGPRRFINEMFI